jgi:hypothetical protein
MRSATSCAGRRARTESLVTPCCALALLLPGCDGRERANLSSDSEPTRPVSSTIHGDPVTPPIDGAAHRIEIDISGSCRDEYIRSPVTIISPILDGCFRNQLGSVSVGLKVSATGEPSLTQTAVHRGPEDVVQCLEDALKFLRFSKTPSCTATVRVTRT